LNNDIEEQPEPEQCILEEQKESFKKMLTVKQEALKEELEFEKDYYAKFGLYSNRDTEEIENELNIVKKVLVNIDEIPKCKD